MPYTVAQMTRAPGDGADPFHRRMQPGASLGADVKAGIGPFALTAAVNPDFGQVEADPSQVNLTAIETFLEEKRPFFVEGVDLFDFPLGYFYGSERLFYSRRVGRKPQAQVPGNPAYVDAPDVTTILAAAKLTGRTSSGWSLGLLDAVTGEEHARLGGDAASFGDPDFSAREFTASAVLRWEYRPGSTLFVVWSQSRNANDPVWPYGLRRDVRRLFGERPTNAALVKVSYWLGL